MDPVLQNVKLSVIIPVYNEANTLRTVLRRILEAPFSKELVIVDDCSTDGTTQILHDLVADQSAIMPDDRLAPFELKILFHQQNRGKGAAIRTALEAVSGNVTLIQDADLEYNPAEYPQLLEPILAGQADVVYGSRFLGSPHRVLFFWHTVGNKMLTLLSNVLTNLNLTDMETCYKVFRTEIIKEMRLCSNRFGIEPEITAKVARQNVRIYEVPISYAGRTYAEGKKINWKDGISALWAIVRYNLVP